MYLLHDVGLIRPVARLQAGGGSFLGGVDLPRGVWGHAPPALKIFQILFF